MSVGVSPARHRMPVAVIYPIIGPGHHHLSVSCPECLCVPDTRFPRHEPKTSLSAWKASSNNSSSGTGFFFVHPVLLCSCVGVCVRSRQETNFPPPQNPQNLPHFPGCLMEMGGGTANTRAHRTGKRSAVSACQHNNVSIPISRTGRGEMSGRGRGG